MEEHFDKWWDMVERTANVIPSDGEFRKAFAYACYAEGWNAALRNKEETGQHAPNNERAAALDIVKQLAAWCEKFPESSTSPFSGIKQFHEIEDAAKRLVESLNAETGTSPVS
jgi:hypothetical protein